MRLTTPLAAVLAALLALTACTDGSPPPDQASPDVSTPPTAADEDPSEAPATVPSPEPTPDPLDVSAAQLHGPQLAATSHQLVDLLADASQIDTADIDGGSLYLWGSSHFAMEPDDDTDQADWHYPVRSSESPTFISAERSGVVWQGQHAQAAQDAADGSLDEELFQSTWSEDAYSLFRARLNTDPDGDPATGVDDGEVHTRHGSVTVSVTVHDSPQSAAARVDFFAEHDRLADNRDYYAEVTAGALPPLDDPRLDQQHSATATLLDDHPSDTTDYAGDHSEAHRLVRSGNTTISVTLSGTVDPNQLSQLSADAIILALDALDQPFQPGPQLTAEDARSTAVKDLDTAITSPHLYDAAGVQTIDVAGPDFYTFAITGTEGDDFVYRRGAPDMVVYPADSDLARSVQPSSYLPLTTHTSAFLDGRIYQVDDAGPNPMRSRIEVLLRTTQRIEDADHQLHWALSTNDTDQRLADLDEPRLTEHAVHRIEPRLPGSDDEPDIAADGLSAVEVVGRSGTAMLRITVAGTADVAELRDIAGAIAADALDAYGIS